MTLQAMARSHVGFLFKEKGSWKRCLAAATCMMGVTLRGGQKVEGVSLREGEFVILSLLKINSNVPFSQLRCVAIHFDIYPFSR